MRKKFTKLKKDVEHHANEEETELFPPVEENLDKKQLAELGKKMRIFKMKFNKKANGRSKSAAK